jgi:hypothetical protein
MSKINEVEIEILDLEESIRERGRVILELTHKQSEETKLLGEKEKELNTLYRKKLNTF